MGLHKPTSNPLQPEMDGTLAVEDPTSLATPARICTVDRVRAMLESSDARLRITTDDLVPTRPLGRPDIELELPSPTYLPHPTNLLRLLHPNELVVDLDNSSRDFLTVRLGSTLSTTIRTNEFVGIDIVSPTRVRPQALKTLGEAAKTVDPRLLPRSDDFHLRFCRSFDELKGKLRIRCPDLVVVSREHNEAEQVINFVRRKGSSIVLTLDDVTPRLLVDFSQLKCRLSECINQLQGSSIVTAIPVTYGSVTENIRSLYSGVLGQMFNTPLRIRSVLQKINETILPLARSCHMPHAWTFPTADEGLILPLIYYHRDERELVEHTKALAISPTAALGYFATDALHMRFFSNYDFLDVLKAPILLDIILPYVNELLDEIGKRPVSTEHEMELRRNLRGLMNGLVLLADFGAFDKLGPFKYKSPRAHVVIPDKYYDLYGTTPDAFRDNLENLGGELMTLMKRAYKILPGEFTYDIPYWSEYFYGYYGNDELEAINLFNQQWPEKRITFFDVVTGSTRPEVMEYYKLHKGKKVKGREGQKRAQHSEDARAHTLYAREVWRRVVAHVRDETPVIRNLIALRPAPALTNVIRDLSAAAATRFPHWSSEQIFVTRLCEWLSKFPPPRDSRGMLLAYMSEGSDLCNEILTRRDRQNLRLEKYFESATREPEMAIFDHVMRVQRTIQRTDLAA